MVGYSSDTCNVMFGINYSVATHLRAVIPQVVTIKCGCHMLALCSSYACAQLPDHLEDLMRSITSHFSNAPKAIRALAEFQDAMKLAILKPGQTRWLTKEPCVKRIIKEYDPLVSYFKALVVTDKCNNNSFMLSSLLDPITMIYFEFLGYALGLFNTANRIFQSEKPLIHTLKTEIETIIETMARAFMIPECFENVDLMHLNVKDENLYLPSNSVYIGTFSLLFYQFRFFDLPIYLFTFLM